MDTFHKDIYNAVKQRAEEAQEGSHEEFIGYALSCFVLKVTGNDMTPEMETTIEAVTSCVIEEISKITEVDALEMANQILDEVNDGKDVQ